MGSIWRLFGLNIFWCWKTFSKKMYGLEKNLLNISIFQLSRFPFFVLFLQDFAKDNPVWGPKRENACKWFMLIWFYLFLMCTSKGVPDNTRRNVSQKSTVRFASCSVFFSLFIFWNQRTFFLNAWTNLGCWRKPQERVWKKIGTLTGRGVLFDYLNKAFFGSIFGNPIPSCIQEILPWKKRFLTSASNCLCESSI